MANEQSSENYAQAIFEQATADWLTPLKYVAERLKPEDVGKLDEPDLTFAQKEELLQKALPANSPKEVRNFLSLLASRNEIHLLPSVISEFDRYSQRGPQTNLARITSAVPLTDSEKSQLENKLRGRFGQETDFQYAVNPAILGGVIVRMGDKVIDGSVTGKLAALKEKLK